MKAVRWLSLLLFAALLWSSAIVFTSTAEAQTIRALLVGNDSNVPRYAKNMDTVVGLLRAIGTHEVCAVKDVRVGYGTADTTPASERIEKWLEDVRPGGNDVVFVYYSRERNSDDSLDLEELVGKIGKLPGRLKILITDTDVHRVENAVGTTGNGAPNALDKAVLEDLFVKHKGFLHLTSKSEREFAFGDANGGWFTQALIDAISAAPANEDSPVTWKDVLETTQEGIKELYSEHSANFSDELKTIMARAEIKESQTPMSLSDFPTLIPTVHALLVIADIADAGTKSVAEMNHIRIRGLLRGAQELGICNLRLVSLRSSEGNVTLDKIKEWAGTTISPLADDTVFVYYSANDGPAADAGSQEEILKAVEKAMGSENAKKSRLQMLIVDTYRLGPAVLVPRFGLPYPQTTFHNLFLEHKGFLHLVSKSKDEFAFGDGSDGGWFTRALIESIYEIRKREDFPPQVPNNSANRKFLEWKELVKKTGEKIQDEFFDKRYPEGFEDAENYPETFSEEQRDKLLEALDEAEKSQTPMAHKLPKRERRD